jgi:hypothetical protein
LPKNIDELIRMIGDLTIRDIQIALRGISLGCQNQLELLNVVDALTLKAAGLKASEVSVKWAYPRANELLSICYEYALIAMSAYNPDKE